MKKKNALKRAGIKLDLEKIEIDVLSDSMLNALQGGYPTQRDASICGECDPQHSNMCATGSCTCGYMGKC